MGSTPTLSTILVSQTIAGPKGLEELPDISQHHAVEVADRVSGWVRLRYRDSTQFLYIQTKAIHMDATANRTGVLVERDEGRVAGIR